MSMSYRSMCRIPKLSASAVGAVLSGVAIVATAAGIDPTDRGAVLAAVDAAANECRQAADDTCTNQCEVAKRSIQSEYGKSVPNLNGVRIFLQGCLDEKHNALARANTPPADANAWTVAGGIGLGMPYTKLFEGKSQYNVEATGYDPATQRRLALTTVLQGQEMDPPPPLVREYMIKVFDGPVTLEGEATGEGALYVVVFRQKGTIDVDSAIAQVIGRFGPPRTRSGGAMQWGDCVSGACADADITPHRIEVRIQDDSMKQAWLAQYETRRSGGRGLAF